MMKTPCEEIYFKILPLIRKELAKVLVSEYKMSQKEVANVLGVTEAAVSQYLKGKRGKQEINEKMKESIRRIAKDIVNRKEKNISICLLCREIRSVL